MDGPPVECVRRDFNIGATHSTCLARPRRRHKIFCGAVLNVEVLFNLNFSRETCFLTTSSSIINHQSSSHAPSIVRRRPSAPGAFSRQVIAHRISVADASGTTPCTIASRRRRRRKKSCQASNYYTCRATTRNGKKHRQRKKLALLAATTN